ncbi:MAG: hypothetical protein K2X66_02185 [Cyanobacteria bacterium]|nr:hypothetical protein [Cyanobacteriota bacterium]
MTIVSHVQQRFQRFYLWLYPLSVFVIFLLWLGRDNFASIDLWGKLSIAAVYWQTGQFPYHDFFSFTAFGAPWRDHEWLSGFVFYGALWAWGDTGLTLLKFLMAGLVIFFVFRTTTRLSIPPILPLLFLGMGLPYLETGFLATGRPQIFTFAGFSLLIYWLELFRLEWFQKKQAPQKNERFSESMCQKPYWLWLVQFLLIGCVWGNLHGGFVSGMGLVVLVGFGDWLSKRSVWVLSKYLGLVFVFFLGTLVNPYGFALWEYLLFAISLNRAEITEWQGMGWQTAQDIPLKLMMIFSLTGAISWKIQQWRRRKGKSWEAVDWVGILVLFVLAYLASRYQKHQALWVIGSSVYGAQVMQWACIQVNSKIRLFATSGHGVFKQVQRFLDWVGSPQNVESVRWGIPVGILISALVFIVSQCLILKTYPNPWEVQVRDETYAQHPWGEALRHPPYPVGAIRFLQKSQRSGNLLTPFSWGEFAYWNLFPRFHVSLDGRYEAVYSPQVFADFNHFSNRSLLRWSFIHKYPVDYILVDKALFQKPEKLPKLWQILYEDVRYAVLGKTPAFTIRGRSGTGDGNDWKIMPPQYLTPLSVSHTLIEPQSFIEKNPTGYTGVNLYFEEALTSWRFQQYFKKS